MKNFEYYGLFLTEESKTKLKAWLWENDYDFNNDIIKGTLPENWYLNHCTLLHRSHDNPSLEGWLDRAISKYPKSTTSFLVDGIGVSEKAMAFRCKIDYCANEIPHITICTFNGGKPVDSNSITEWKDIKPIIVKAKLEKR